MDNNRYNERDRHPELPIDCIISNLVAERDKLDELITQRFKCNVDLWEVRERLEKIITGLSK